MKNRTLNTYISHAIMGLVFLLLFVPLIVSNSLYFPYITGKAHYLRLIIEVALALYGVLIIRDRSFLPKKSFLLWSMLAFTIVLGISTLTAEDPSKSFWSNFERMEGYVMILHLFALLIVAGSVLKTKRAWNYILNSTLVISILVGFDALGDYRVHAAGQPAPAWGTLRIAGPLGNSSYLGVYALIHMFIGALLIAGVMRLKSFKQAPVQISAYILAIIFNCFIMYNTGTRGSFVGLFVALFVTAILVLILNWGNKLYRKIGIGAIILVLVVVGLLGAFKNSAFVQKSDMLNRFSSLITFNVKSVFETQGYARTVLWSMALKGVEERPILGWGQDNFGYVFAKYYDPRMYGQEQWFDRTHDVFFDWLIAGGILGLLGYLSLFVAALYMLWKKPKNATGESAWSLSEKCIITGLFVAYFVHNLFVFDNLSSYIICFVLFAYIHSTNKSMQAVTEKDHDHSGLVKGTALQATLIGLVVIAFGFTFYYVVWRPYEAGRYLIFALEDDQRITSGASSASLATSTAATSVDSPSNVSMDNPDYKPLLEIEKALSLNTLGNAEIRERLIDITTDVISKQKDPQVMQAYVVLTNNEYAKQMAATPNDPRPFIFYAMFLQKIGLYQQSLTYVDKALALSPTKQSFFYQKGVAQVELKQFDDAVATFQKAYQLDTDDEEAKALYLVALIYDNKASDAMTVIMADQSIMTDTRILEALSDMNDYADIVTIAKAKIASDPTNPQYHMSLAGAYLKLHDSQDAISEIKTVIQLAPQFAQTGNYYITEIQEGKDPSAQPAATGAAQQ